jgi:cytochrome c-type biogenesis protein
MRGEYLISFAAGILSFLSPCVLPLIPSYLSFIGGTSLGDLSAESPGPAFRRRLIIRAAAFCAGFAVVFMILGIAFSSVATVLGPLGGIVDVLAGSLVILLGLNILFDFWRLLQADKRFRLRTRPRGTAGAFLAGVAFSAGWSPCVGPILASILFLAAREDSAWTAIAQLGLYSLGLALPFLAMAVFFGGSRGIFGWLKKRLNAIRIVSGVFLVLTGALIALGRFRFLNALFAGFARAVSSLADGPPLIAHLPFAATYVLLALAFLLVPVFRKRREGAHGGDSGRTAGTIALAARVVAAAGFLALALLEATGVIATADGIGAWLRFQGI